jgi:hypothetical protein
MGDGTASSRRGALSRGDALVSLATVGEASHRRRCGRSTMSIRLGMTGIQPRKVTAPTSCRGSVGTPGRSGAPGSARSVRPASGRQPLPQLTGPRVSTSLKSPGVTRRSDYDDFGESNSSEWHRHAFLGRRSSSQLCYIVVNRTTPEVTCHAQHRSAFPTNCSPGWTRRLHRGGPPSAPLSVRSLTKG